MLNIQTMISTSSLVLLLSFSILLNLIARTFTPLYNAKQTALLIIYDMARYVHIHAYLTIAATTFFISSADW